MSSSSRDQFKRSFDEVSGIYLAALRDGSAGAIAKTAEDTAPVSATGDDDPVVFKDDATEKVFALAESVAQTNTTVLLCGESGVGKEVFARFIHRQSRRASGPMIGVNCAALNASLLESELFGHEKGAFSGAVRQHTGVFEQANGGTLLLDEVSEMPLELQAKLLRVIQERQITRVGGTRPIAVDIRIIATTNRDLARYVEDGHFRQDLFFRLNVFPLEIPPLRHRRTDIEPLVTYYARRLSQMFDRPVQGFTGGALRKLETYDFPGNIRELINIVERALIFASGQDFVDAEHIVLQTPSTAIGSPSASVLGHDDSDGLDDDTDVEEEEAHLLRFRAGEHALTDVRRIMIKQTLKHFDGNRKEAAKSLGITTRTIRNKLKDYENDD